MKTTDLKKVLEALKTLNAHIAEYDILMKNNGVVSCLKIENKI